MKILIHGINFHPELIGAGKYTGELAEWLIARGHNVRVVTAPPHYPQWATKPPYRAWKYTREIRETPQQATEKDIKSSAKLEMIVIRCPLWLPKSVTGFRRILCLLSFALSSAPIMLWQSMWRPDVVFAVEPTLFSSFNAMAVGFLCGAKTWLHVQDFEVDAAFAIDGIVSPRMERVARYVEDQVLKRLDCVSTISEKMQEQLERKGVAAKRCALIPNWVDTRNIVPLSRVNPLWKETAISAEKIVVLYSGSMGRKQGLGILVEASKRLAITRPNIHFVFCGEGPFRKDLEDATKDAGNVNFLSLQPAVKLNELLNIADIHILPQCPEAADLVMPSKLTGMLASGRPVVVTASPGTQLYKSMQGVGMVTPPGDVEMFCEAITRLADDAHLRKQCGEASRAYAVAHLDRDVILNRFESALVQLCSGSMARSAARKLEVFQD
jgi:colanic acid biosynthesis glycosyl transferase WcaI